MNFFQLYVGYIGASRAYGVHLEIVDTALFLTNQGITIYLGHKYRWSHKWRIGSAASPVSSAGSRQASKSRTPGRMAAAASGALATAAHALASPVVPVQVYTPVVSVVPLVRGNINGRAATDANSVRTQTKPVKAEAARPDVVRETAAAV